MVRPIRTLEAEANRNARTGIRFQNARKKRRRFRLTFRQVLLVSILLLIFMVSGIGYVWSNFEGTQIGYNMSMLQQKELKLKELNQKLKVELAYLRSPQYLESAARELGLKAVSPAQVVILP